MQKKCEKKQILEEDFGKGIKNGTKKRTWMCAQRRYRKKKTQDTISGNGQRWAGENHADNGDNDVAKMQNEKLTRS